MVIRTKINSPMSDTNSAALDDLIGSLKSAVAPFRATLQELRMAGVTAAALRAEVFEVPAKAAELRALPRARRCRSRSSL